MDSAFCFTTAKSYKISYACSRHFLGYLAVEVSFISDFDVIRKQRVPEKIDLHMDLLLSCFFYWWQFFYTKNGINLYTL
jgi:hypothetical protein